MSVESDPVQVNFFLEHLGKLLGAAAVIILALMSRLNKNNDKASIAKEVLTERPVSHVELLKCQMEVNATIDVHFKELRKELLEAITTIRKETKEDFNEVYKTIDQKTRGIK